MELNCQFRTALVGGKIQLDSVLREISVTLIGQSLSQKMDVLSGNIQNKEIGLLLFAMIKRITKLEVAPHFHQVRKIFNQCLYLQQTMSKSTVNNLKEPTFFSAKKNRVSKSRKRTQSMMNLKKPANIHLRGIQYASSTESEWDWMFSPLPPEITDNYIVMCMQHEFKGPFCFIFEIFICKCDYDWLS